MSGTPGARNEMICDARIKLVKLATFVVIKYIAYLSSHGIIIYLNGKAI